MRCACIDIGSNTTRVLVADVAGDRLEAVLQQRAFTRIGRRLAADGTIPPDTIEHVAAVVAAQIATAPRGRRGAVAGGGHGGDPRAPPTRPRCSRRCARAPATTPSC